MASIEREGNDIPAILREENILIPIKIDITTNGARIVDSFSWSIYNNYMSIDEFALRTCIDLNIPSSFQNKIMLQMKEQIESYHELILLIKDYGPKIVTNWSQKISEILTITMGIRHNSLDYTDKIYWDPMSMDLTPESFAYITCKDLGLPSEIRSAISNKIRETIFRWLISLIEYPDKLDHTSNIAEFKVSDIKVTIAQHPNTVDMATSLWKRAKPNTYEETATIPQPLLPSDKYSNAHIWK